MSLNDNMTLKNSLWLSFEFLENGSVKSIEAGPVRISLKAASPFSKPGANIYLRKRKRPLQCIALLGPESNGLFKMAGDAFIVRGSWASLDYTCVLRLSEKSLSWQWSADIKNLSDNPVELDLIYVQDAGLKPVNA